MAIRTLLVDDHQIVREGLRSLLSRFPDIEIVGEAGDGEAALQLTRQLHPDVVILDISLPGMSGLEVTKEIVDSGLTSRVLALTMHETEQYAVQLLKAGAAGYMVKRGAAEELVSAIWAVYRGETYLYPSVAGKLLQHYLNSERTGGALSLEARNSRALSARQKQVLQLVAQGKTNREISQLLCISLRTVQAHRAKLMEKLGLHNRIELTRYAIREGLVEP